MRVDYQVSGAMRCEWATTLGAGGMFIETENPPPVGTNVRVRFRLSDDSRLHEIDGLVAWAMAASAPVNGPSPSPGMGIEFSDPVAAAALARELERPPGD